MPRHGRWRLQAVRSAFVGKFNKVTTAAYRADCGLRHAQHALAAWASWLIRHAGLGGRRVGSRPSPDTSPPVVGEGFAPGAHGGEAQEGGLARQALEEGPGRRAHGGALPCPTRGARSLLAEKRHCVEGSRKQSSTPTPPRAFRGLATLRRRRLRTRRSTSWPCSAPPHPGNRLPPTAPTRAQAPPAPPSPGTDVEPCLPIPRAARRPTRARVWRQAAVDPADRVPLDPRDRRHLRQDVPGAPSLLPHPETIRPREGLGKCCTPS